MKVRAGDAGMASAASGLLFALALLHSTQSIPSLSSLGLPPERTTYGSEGWKQRQGQSAVPWKLQRRLSSLRGGDATPQIVERFVSEMIDQTEQLLDIAESEPNAPQNPTDDERNEDSTAAEEDATEPELSPVVEQMLDNEIKKLVLEKTAKKSGDLPVIQQTHTNRSKDVVFMPRVPSSNSTTSQAEEEVPAQSTHVQIEVAAKPGPSATQPPLSQALSTHGILPTLVLPGLALLLVVSVVLAAMDGSLKTFVKSHWVHGFGLQPVLALTQDKRARDIGIPLIYIFGGYIFSNWLAFAAQRQMLDFLMVDQTTALFLQGFVKWGSLAIAVSVILRTLGYNNLGLDTLLASSGVAIAFASQTVLKNFASGIIILMFRPFAVGDRVKVGSIQGTVRRIGILETEIITDAGVLIHYSNGSIKEDNLENLTAHGMRRVEVPITVTVDADAVATRKAIEDAIEPFMQLWKKQPKIKRSHDTAMPGRTQSIGELMLGRTATEQIMAKYRETIKVFDRDGDGSVSASELLGALSGDLLKRIAGETDHTAKFAQAKRGYVICVGGTDIGIKWFAHVWAPAGDHDPTFVGVSEAIVKTLQARGIPIAAKAKKS